MDKLTGLFTAEMIAPCGLDCSLCECAHAASNPCPGCNGPDEKKPEFCAKYCGSFSAKSAGRTAIPIAMNARIIPVKT